VLNKFCYLLERNTSSTMRKKIFEGSFVLSCEQDHSVCMPLIESGTCCEFAFLKIFFIASFISSNLSNMFCTVATKVSSPGTCLLSFKHFDIGKKIYGACCMARRRFLDRSFGTWSSQLNIWSSQFNMMLPCCN
jgi:hypothetical protein